MSSSNNVYIKDKKECWLPANVVSSDEKTATVRVEGEEESRTIKLSSYPDGNLPLQNVTENGNLIVMQDLCDLPYLHEPAILYNIKARHEVKEPYTRVGEIIIAANPFQWIEHLYTEKTRELYANRFVWNANKDDVTILAPHVYETSSLAYRGLAIDGQDQSILVSGESGAGKTETVKIVMNHLASIHAVSSSDSSSDSETGGVVKRVLDSNPLLEAFGNAKTVRNDNSSRFGKYIQLQFDVEDSNAAAYSGKSVPSCLLAGSVCETYLLEKSRVVMHDSTERTYHIFYQIIDAKKEDRVAIWKELENVTFDSFRYVGNTDTLRIEGKTDGEKYERTKYALEIVGVKDEKLVMLMRAVCTVMQLGNIVFEQDKNNDDASCVESTDELAKLANLIGVEVPVVEKALTTRTVVAGKERYTVPLKVVDARDSCDAFAKEIFQQVFDWLVKTINEATCAEQNYSYASDVEDYGLVGLLDIFGFESFKVNRFEQLCINYANEKLQQKYTIDVFQSVKEEYDFEGIELANIKFEDNTEVLNLVEGRMGIISVLNEECRRPRGNDAAFVSKVKSMNNELSCMIVNRLHRPVEFAIEHYAGPVKYDATNFVQKNMDNIPNDLLECAAMSTNEIIAKELQAAASKKKSGKGGKAVTVSTNFRQQLSSLMLNISKTRTRYIRCLKPNPEKVPYKMNLTSSMDQLRCAGVIAAVTISRMAFPNRLLQETAVERFRCLSSMEIDIDFDEKKEDDNTGGFREFVEKFFTDLLKSVEKTDGDGNIVKGFVCGKTRIYFRTGAVEYLEAERMIALGKLAREIQKQVRCFVAKSNYQRLKRTTISAQAWARRTIARNYFLRMVDAQTTLACWTRCNIAKSELIFLKKQKACTLFQSCWRMCSCRKQYLKERNAAIFIQKIGKGVIQRRAYKVMKAEAEAEARMNTKLAALQKRLTDTEMKWLQADKARLEAEKKASSLEASGAVVGGEPREGAITAQQKALIDESGKMLGYLRNEVLKLRSKNYQLRSELNEIKVSYNEMSEHYTSITASYEALKQHTTQLSLSNMKQKVEWNNQKEALLALKRENKTILFSQKSELRKVTEDFRNKENIYTSEISKLKDEVDSLKRRQHKSPSTQKRPQKRSRNNQNKSSSSLKNYLSHQKALSNNQYTINENEDEIFVEEQQKRRGRNFWAAKEEKKGKKKEMSSLQKSADNYSAPKREKSSLASLTSNNSKRKVAPQSSLSKAVPKDAPQSSLSKVSQTKAEPSSTLQQRSQREVGVDRTPKTKANKSRSLQKASDNKPSKVSGSSLSKATEKY